MSAGNNNFFKNLVFALFIALLFIIKFGFHELWKDEWQAWLIATDTSWKEMINLLPQEGHPSLWFLLLRGINYIHELILPGLSDVYVLQSLHFLLTAGTFYLLIKKIELPLWMKTGFGFSYFLFFEYGIINRSYILIPLFLFAIVYLLQKKNFNYYLVSILLFLLCQVEIYGVIAAGAILLYIWLEKSEKIFTPDKDKLILTLSFIVGVILFYVSVVPKGQAETATFEQASSLTVENFLKPVQALTINTFYPGIFPTAISDFNFLLAIAGSGMLVAFYFFFKKERNILIVYGAFLIVMWLFSSVIYIGGMRHWGMHFIFFISVLSLYFNKTKQFLLREKGIIISFIFFLSLHNIKIISREIKEPFSNSREAGLFIKNNYPDFPVVGINKPYMTPAIGYAEKRFYSLPYGDTYSYFKWKEKQYIPNMNDLLKFKNEIGAEQLIVIFNKPLPQQIFPHLQMLRSFNKPSIREEDFYIYLMN